MNQNFKTSILVVFACFSLAACKNKKEDSSKAMDTQEQSVSYAIGMDVGFTLKQMKEQGASIDMKAFNEALTTVMEGKEPKLSSQQAQEVVMKFLLEQQQKAQIKVAEQAKINLEKGQAFLKANKAKANIKTTASGLQYQVKTEGNGVQPKATDTVTVEYEGRLIDGTVFDRSGHGSPVTFALDKVIRGWTEGLQLMKEGAEYTFFIPAGLAYGDRTFGDIAPNSTLVFDVKLIKVEKSTAK